MTAAALQDLDPRAWFGTLVTRGKGAKDLRSDALQRCDAVWAQIGPKTLERFGKSPSLDLADQPSAPVAAALSAVHAAERNYLRLAAMSNVPPDVVTESADRFFTAVASWLTAATQGWPSAKEHAARALREREWWKK